MKKTLVSILSVLMFTNAFAVAFDVRPEDIKKDKEALIRILEKGQCGQVCVRYDRTRFLLGNPTEFGFCRISVTVCKE